MGQAQMHRFMQPLADMFFGDDAINERGYIESRANKFLEQLLVITWARYRKRVTRLNKKLPGEMQAADTQWEGECTTRP